MRVLMTLPITNIVLNTVRCFPLFPLTPEILRTTSASRASMRMVTLPALKIQIYSMVYDGLCRGKNCIPRNKWLCAKSKKLPGSKYQCFCDDPCTPSKCGRIFYTYPKNNYRVHPPVPRNSEKWNKYAHLRHIVEQVISMLKLPLQLGKLYTQNLKTAKANFFMARVAHLITVLLAYRMGVTDKIRCSKSLVA